MSRANFANENAFRPAAWHDGSSFYLFTCEYCFSHYAAAGILIITRYKLLFPDWRGYFVAFFSLVWTANQYMSIYNRLRLDIKHEQAENQGGRNGSRTTTSSVEVIQSLMP